jgi:SAM-dependent methyltransferase
MAAAAFGVMAWTEADSRFRYELWLQIGVFCLGLFIACMFCHGELVRLKPAPRYLTRFYLMLSLGGAVGAVLVGIVAPLVLPAHFELALGLVAGAFLLAWQVRRMPLVFPVLAIAAALTTVGAGVWSVREFYDDVILSKRNFYGVLRVTEWGKGDPVDHRRSLIHGSIMHGQQFLGPTLKTEPTSYYTATSGIGRLLESLHPRKDPLKVGIIGLGAGTIATYGAKGDTYRFYDINPDVMTIAQRDFTFLKDSAATIELVLGDARLSLEREPPEHFDVLAIDAFSSDAIPVHLITSEALAVYRRHMKPGGVIAFHVTNRYLDLVPVVQALADAQGMKAILIRDETKNALTSTSDWVLLSDDPAALAKPDLADNATPIEARPDWRLWTDDFNNLVQVLK